MPVATANSRLELKLNKGKNTMTRGLNNKPCGSSHYRSTLNEEKVRIIRANYMPFAFSAQKCADLVGCTLKAAQSVISLETWRHVK